MTRQEIATARALLTDYYATSVSGSVLATPARAVTCDTTQPAPKPPVSPERQALLIEQASLRAEIDAAYWRFTRQARAVPPSMQCPEAYARLQEIDALAS